MSDVVFVDFVEDKTAAPIHKMAVFGAEAVEDRRAVELEDMHHNLTVSLGVQLRPSWCRNSLFDLVPHQGN